MYRLEYSSQFKKDFKKITKKPIPDIVEVGHVIFKLQQGEALDAKYVDHPLTGNWNGFHDCHIKDEVTH